jgi:hypothetical protein
MVRTKEIKLHQNPTFLGVLSPLARSQGSIPLCLRVGGVGSIPAVLKAQSMPSFH